MWQHPVAAAVYSCPKVCKVSSIALAADSHCCTSQRATLQLLTDTNAQVHNASQRLAQPFAICG
jgi:hypothetical protein